jgi:hypothetical protein
MSNTPILFIMHFHFTGPLLASDNGKNRGTALISHLQSIKLLKQAVNVLAAPHEFCRSGSR